jgi:hypothetical protein
MRAMTRRAKVIPFPGPLERARRAGTPRQPTVEPSGMVEVHRCDQAEAVVIRGLFESEGIPTLLRSRLAHSVHPFSVGAQGEVVVLVPPSEVARARLLLA